MAHPRSEDRNLVNKLHLIGTSAYKKRLFLAVTHPNCPLQNKSHFLFALLLCTFWLQLPFAWQRTCPAKRHPCHALHSTHNLPNNRTNYYGLMPNYTPWHWCYCCAFHHFLLDATTMESEWTSATREGGMANSRLQYYHLEMWITLVVNQMKTQNGQATQLFLAHLTRCHLLHTSEPLLQGTMELLDAHIIAKTSSIPVSSELEPLHCRMNSSLTCLVVELL